MLVSGSVSFVTSLLYSLMSLNLTPKLQNPGQLLEMFILFIQHPCCGLSDEVLQSYKFSLQLYIIQLVLCTCKVFVFNMTDVSWES